MNRKSIRLQTPSSLMRMRTLWTVLAVALGASACDLDLQNPNAPTEDEVLTDNEGLVSLAIGMQGEFAEAIDDFVLGPALVTDEWGTGTRSLIAYQSLLTGDNFDFGYGVVEAPWADAFEVIRAANGILENVQGSTLPAGLQTGLTALAKTHKAMSLGMIIQQYERVPVTVSSTGSPLVERQAVFDSILSLLQSARQDLATLSPAELATLRSRAVPAAFNLPATVDAMIARYSLFAARERDNAPALYQQALDAANRVPANTLSAVTYAATNVNQIYNLSVVAQYVFPLRSFVSEAQEGDQRPAYWVSTTAEPFAGNPDSLLLPLGKYNQPTGDFPVFLPDEMTLIRAEAQTRLGNLAAARELVNAVRTQTTAAVDEPVAGLPALPAEALDTVDELLREIAYNRRYELYMQGLRWEDARTLQPYVTTEPTFQFFPVPQQECVTNPAINC